MREANTQGIEMHVRAFLFLLGTRSKRICWMDAWALRRRDAYEGE